MDHTSIPTRRWISWSRDAAERALKTFAQGVLASGLIMEGASFDAVLSVEPWSIGATAAVLSILASLASKQVGSPATARLDV